MTEQQHRDRLKLNGWPRNKIDEYISGWRWAHRMGMMEPPSGSGYEWVAGWMQGNSEAMKK